MSPFRCSKTILFGPTVYVLARKSASRRYTGFLFSGSRGFFTYGIKMDTIEHECAYLRIRFLEDILTNVMIQMNPKEENEHV